MNKNKSNETGLDGVNNSAKKTPKQTRQTKSQKGSSPGPTAYGWLGLGLGKGIKWTLWNNSVVFQRREKQGDNWLTTEELHVAPRILKEIVWRIPGWLESIDKNNGRGSK